VVPAAINIVAKDGHDMDILSAAYHTLLEAIFAKEEIHNEEAKEKQSKQKRGKVF
jgi:hypothetical protein